MVSMAGQPHFRYTQPPSKVLHMRNLSWECNEEDLIKLCKPFGKVVNTKVNVDNQAFIEFSNLNQAIAMVSYHASLSKPAEVRGKTVYLQYSNRSKALRTLLGGPFWVFSTFGFVHKIATFEKHMVFQELVQFTDANIASAIKSTLEGRSIHRDYTNPYLSVAPLVIDGSTQFSIGPDGKRREPESNVLLLSIENM